LPAARLMKRNVDVLMDRAPADAEQAAAQRSLHEPPVTLSDCRMRQEGPRQFMDVVITVPPGAAVGQGHAGGISVEDALTAALPEATLSSTFEPQEDEAAIRRRAHAAALGVFGAGGAQRRGWTSAGARRCATPEASRRR